MKRLNVLTLFLLFVFCLPATARSFTQQEKAIRETYRKLEKYNAAAQIFQQEQSAHASSGRGSLTFELTDFHSGDLQEINGERYADVVTLPTAADVTTLFPTVMLPLVNFPVLTSKLRVAVTSIDLAVSGSLVLS